MFEANEQANGLFGKIFDETGGQLSSAQEFEVNAEFEKKEIKIPGVFWVSTKVTGGKITGKMKIAHIDTRLPKKVIENPTAKYNYLGKLEDPDAKGAEAVLLIGVNFNGAQLMKWALGELVDDEIEFTADNAKYTAWID